MREERGWKRSVALTALAGALAWSAPSPAVEAETDRGGATTEEPVYHTVESGDTIWEIADRYGSSVASLIRENEIEDPSKLWVGKRLRIPARHTAAAPVRTLPEGDPEDREPIGVGALVDRCEAELRAARFEQALASAQQARDRINARNGASDPANRIRLEIASATAYVALGQHDAALESFERALTADPDLELDLALTSPKVLAVFRAARGRASRQP